MILRYLAPFAALTGGFLAPQLAEAQEAAKPPAYQVDAAASRVYIKVSSATRLGHPHGVIGRLASGQIVPGGAGELIFDMTTFMADTPEARTKVGLDPNFSDAQKVNANMRGPDVLNVSQFPRAVLAITSIQPTGGQAAGEPGRYLLDGRFTLHGTTRPLQVAAQLDATDRANVLRLHGSFTIQQSQYGIQPYSALGGLVRVADGLQIWGDLFLTPIPH